MSSIGVMGLITGYEGWMYARGLGRTTVGQRLTFAQSRAAEWGAWDLPPGDVARWLGGYTGWTRVTYYSHLRCLYTWLTETGRVERHPLEGVRRPPHPRPRPRPLTLVEVDRALLASSGDVEAFLLLGLRAGLRAHEIAKVRGEDVTERWITVLGKGGRVATVPTHPQVWRLALDRPEGWWFPSSARPGEPIAAATVSRAVTALFTSLGIEGSSHRARHSYGTQLARNGTPIRVVQELLRHSSLATTAAYVGVDDDERTSAVHALSA